MTKAPLKSNPDRLKLLESLILHRRQIQKIDERRALGELMIGPLWIGWKTDVTKALKSVQWMNEQIELLGSPDALKTQLQQWPGSANPNELANELQTALSKAEQQWQKVEVLCDLDLQQAFGRNSIRKIPLKIIRDRVLCWLNDPEGQGSWIRLYDCANEVSDRGLDELRRDLARGSLAPEHACSTFDYVRAEAIYTRLVKLNPRLGKMSGRERSKLVDEFRDLDARLLHLSAQEVMAAHYDSIPEGERGRMGLLRGEAKKKTRHMPLRRLLKDVGDAVQTLKPVFLMSPLSVAQYLDSENGLTFDLLLIDEASQIRPQNAIGAIMRAERVIIVGDQKQLPPTMFFDKLVTVGGENAETLEDARAEQVGDMESILALCEARNMPGCMLEWHYRSQHESLITVSNQEFYKNRLICPPSPSISNSELGLSFEYVGGLYRRGKSKGDNPQEAAAVMEAVLAHAKARPNESLGVVAMSKSQQTTIQNEAERMRGIHPELNRFCNESKDEPFFVKNLETVQGDERDVIFISIGYGRTEGGQLFQNFGPVSKEGGERRLNVLFTRAKKRCRVFSSIRHNEIKHSQSPHRGPYMLKTFLQYAETGEMDIPVPTGNEPDSLFEEAVADAVREHGFDVDYQVGSAGFRIDLAVKDPDHEDRYLLAIECDGARYHSSFWARERDRMRQELLEAKGWRFHRIWGTDWFSNPAKETERAVAAIRKARSRGVRSTPKPQRQPAVERDEKPNDPPSTSQSEYKEFDPDSFDSPAYYLHINDAKNSDVADLIIRIVEVEGPVHQDIIIRKTRQAWGYEQTGKQIRKKIQTVLQSAVDHQRIERCELDQNFLKMSHAKVQVRDRSKLAPELRKPHMIPPEEYQQAILCAVKRCFGASEEECAVESARIFGFRSTSAAFKKEVAKQIPPLIQSGHLMAEPDGTLRIKNQSGAE